MGIRLRDDVFFSDPVSRIREYCEIEVYEGYDDRHTENNVIMQADIDSANNLYAMIDRYDKTESRRILEQSVRLSGLLAEIPFEAIYLYSDEEWSDLKPKIEALLGKMISIRGVGVEKSMKILHLKRPELFPVLDAYVIQFLTGKPLSSSQRDIGLAVKALDLSREIIRTQIMWFTELQRGLGNLLIPLTMVRLFDILCWSTYKWDMLGRTSAPRGVASKSLISYSKHAKPVPVKVKLIPSKAPVRTPESPSASSVVIDFFNVLSTKAKYGVRGEKPMAVLAVLEYLMKTRQIGVRFLDLLDYPYYERVRTTYIALAEKFGSFPDPSGSWSVITGRGMELQSLIVDDGRVDQAIANLSKKEIELTYKALMRSY
ncbi:hypothetical protein E4H04_05440 [Candidatus Bathyarchaeota archaeon]|jgi:hypothetical protein|nr:MAG: hypothetical protein E4H04_05440 [Candidatus Bathyarchaeota archaeon]